MHTQQPVQSTPQLGFITHTQEVRQYPLSKITTEPYPDGYYAAYHIWITARTLHELHIIK